MSASPAHRAALSARAKAQWSDPQKRARLMASLRRIQWTEEMLAVLRQCRRYGMSWERTAQRLGVAINTAYFQGRRLGLTGERGGRAA